MTPVLVLLAATATPTPSPAQLQPWEVSPGIEGFFWGFFVLALVSIVLFRSMTKHMRRVDHNQRLLERAEAERAEAERAGADGGAEGIPARPTTAGHTAAETGADGGPASGAGGPTRGSATPTTGPAGNAERTD